MRNVKRILPVLLIFAVVAGCGYSFSPGGEYIDKGIQTVYIDNLANRTSEPNVENNFRSALIDQFRKSSRFKLADRKEEADAILRGSIVNLSSSHLSYSRADVAKEDRVTAVLDLTFEERVSKKIIWSNSAFSWYADYAVDSTNTLTTDTNKKAALDKLATDTADRAYRLMMSGF